MARASTTPQPAPAPCSMRPASSIARLAAAMQLAAPQVNSTSPPRSTRLRPKRSDKPPYATVKKAIDSIASDIVSCAMPVETPKASFTAGMAGMNRCSESGPMKVMETRAMKKYQRGRNGIVMLEVSIAGEQCAAGKHRGGCDDAVGDMGPGPSMLPADSWIVSHKANYRSSKKRFGGDSEAFAQRPHHVNCQLPFFVENFRHSAPSPENVRQVRWLELKLFHTELDGF